MPPKYLALALTTLSFALAACLPAALPTPATPTTTPTTVALPTLDATPSAPAAVAVAAEVDVYDPTRDPAADVAQAVMAAQASGKRILLEVGGEWCVWCHIMDDFYTAHPALLKFRQDHYVSVKINFSEENYNADFLGQYPEIPGYPHIFVLASDGTFLHSQSTAELEQGESYNLDKFMGFLQQWAQP